MSRTLACPDSQVQILFLSLDSILFGIQQCHINSIGINININATTTFANGFHRANETCDSVCEGPQLDSIGAAYNAAG
ncbi:hypothetical protein GB937_003008 [Aspergillus fischeri]|nr:hypothetical protein GB937_003008 [Aspergillus fischeri]